MSLSGHIIHGLRSAVDALAGEEVSINGVKLMAIVNEMENGTALGLGAMNNDRTLTVQFKTGLVALDPKGRNTAEARGLKWQVSSEPGSIRVGAAATSITLIEPERRRAD